MDLSYPRPEKADFLRIVRPLASEIERAVALEYRAATSPIQLATAIAVSSSLTGEFAIHASVSRAELELVRGPWLPTAGVVNMIVDLDSSPRVGGGGWQRAMPLLDAEVSASMKRLTAAGTPRTGNFDRKQFLVFLGEQVSSFVKEPQLDFPRRYRSMSWRADAASPLRSKVYDLGAALRSSNEEIFYALAKAAGRLVLASALPDLAEHHVIAQKCMLAGARCAPLGKWSIGKNQKYS